VRYKSFSYQAGSWTQPRRIVAKVEHHAGELFPRVGFIVTNLGLPSRAVVRFYNRRGTAEQWIKEGKQARMEIPVQYDSRRMAEPSRRLVAQTTGRPAGRIRLSTREPEECATIESGRTRRAWVYNCAHSWRPK